MPAAGVVGTPAAEPNGAVADVMAALALLAEAVVLELQHGGEGERIVRPGDIDVLGADARVRPQDLAGVAAGHGGDRPGLVVHIAAWLAAAAHHAADQHGWVAAVTRALGARDNDGSGVVGLDATVEQVQRLADDAAGEHVLHRYPRLVVGLGIVGGMSAVGRA